MFVIIVTTTIMYIASEQMARHMAEEQLSHSRQKVLTALSMRTEMATTLVDAIATTTLSINANRRLMRDIIPQMITHRDSQHLIAGGGIWPEPGAFTPGKERDSYFWGRNDKSELTLYDDYNQPQGEGYHHEEWYVPSRYLLEHEVYWSKSYTDPHSLQAMVTVTAPMYRKGQYIGAATVDLKLEGLQEILNESTKSFDGYSFAVDRHGRLLSFPDSTMARQQGITTGGSLVPFLTIEELSQNHPEFSEFKAHIYEEQTLSSNTHINSEIEYLANKLDQDSYQVSYEQARRIASNILDKRIQRASNNIEEEIVALSSDYFLKEPALAVITKIPATDWRIVTVMPESYARKSSNMLITLISISIIVTLFIAMIAAWLLLKRLYADPLDDLTSQLQNSLSDQNYDKNLICLDNQSELGALAHWFNQRTHELLHSKQQVKSLEYYDSLTGLPNRSLLNVHLEQKLAYVNRTNTSGAVMFIDLDHFKNLNDSLGHDIGDLLLVSFSQRLSNCLREDDFVARLGGDEFVIVLSQHIPAGNKQSRIPEIIAKKILDNLAEPFLLDDNLYHVTASIGIALFGKGELDTKDILKFADAAMYQSKSSGRNTYCFFEEEMQIKVDQRLRIEKDLRKAIEHDELSLAFQPQVTSSSRCPSVEALVRWIHPTEGFISPMEFIAIAEESMLILSLGDWVLNRACQQIKEWEKQGASFDHVAINISPIQFQQPDFVDHIMRRILEHQVSPKSIMVEITEGVIIDNPESVIEKILELKKIGIRVSIDDFGTGYSSLTYLKRLPLDELKIDRSFVQEIESDRSDAVITETIIAMAHNFGYEVIAEGVETEQQRDILMEKGCHFFQGYLFSRPLPPEEIPDFLQEFTEKPPFNMVPLQQTHEVSQEGKSQQSRP